MKLFKMTEKDYTTLLDSCKPVPLIALQCGMPSTPQERANEAWKQLGEKMGFDSTTVKPSAKGHLYFTAEPTIDYGEDGNKITATRLDFTNLQEHSCGFGDTEEEALLDLLSQE
jgi:hypothetical protein